MVTININSILKFLASIFLAIAGLIYAKTLLVPIVIGGVLATLFLPMSRRLERHRVSKFFAALLCILTLVCIIVFLGYLLGWQITELANDLGLIKEKALAIAADMQHFIFNHFGITLTEQTQIIKDQQDSVAWLIQYIAGSLASFITAFLLTLIYVFLLLFYRGHIKQFILQLSPESQRPEVEQLVMSAANVSQQYLLGLSKMIACLWILYSIGFSILGLKNAVFFAILCGFLEIVPFIGNITGTAITVLAAATQGADLGLMAGIIVTYAGVQLTQAWILGPLILGPQVSLNPLFTIVALVVGEMVWGIPGIILAIPLAAIFKIICDHITPLKPFGFLIGEIKTNREPPKVIKNFKNWVK